jgi:hypothetical protein
MIDSDCTIDCERMPECTTCRRTKKPIGRDPGIDADYCGHDCPGYREAPTPGHLWPGELQRERESDEPREDDE